MYIGMAVALVVYIVWCYKTWGDDYREPVITFFLSLFIGGLAGSLFLGLPLSYVFVDDTEVTHELKVLNDGKQTRGTFFLGTGFIGDDPAFNFYYVDDEGKTRLKMVDAEDASVVEYDGTPKVVQKCDDYRNTPHWLVAPITFFTDDNGLDCFGDWTFYIPEDSIKTDYSLDAK